MTTSPQPMDEGELAALLAAHEQRAIGYFESEIAAEQARAINYYYGLMEDLPALDGCSSVVDHSVAVMVDNALAAVLKPFVSADEVVSFAPRGPEDVAQAEQATDFVNYVVNCDNPGFLILHNWFKDALLTKIGVVKVWWEDQSRRETRTIGATALELEQLRQAPNYLTETDNKDGTFAVTVEQETEDGRVRIENIPPEEFLISPFARSIEEAPYCAHRPGNYTRSDLIELGVDPAIAADLPAFAQGRGGEARSQARYRDEQWGGIGDGMLSDTVGSDRSRDLIGVLDEFVRCDFDGDGIAELRRVIRVGDTILFNEAVDDNAFALLCPCPMPHKVYGRSTADQALEGQKVRTAILRQTLDNLYKTNNPRPIIGDGAINDATMDDLGDSSPGAVIRTKTIGELSWAAVPFTAGNSFNMLEYIAQEIEEQTGVQRKGNGFNAEALRKNSRSTATAAAIDENSRNERAEMVARIFAETGVKRLFRLVLKLLVQHQPRARMIRLRGTWVPVDPTGWNADMDLAISVGLGMGNKAELIEQANEVLVSMAQLQATPFAYLVDAKKVHNALKRKFTAAGIKSVDDYLNDPAQAQPPEPQKPADQVRAEAEIQARAAELQLKQADAAANLQLKQAEAAARRQIAESEAQARVELERYKVAAQAETDRLRAEFEARLAEQKAAQEFELARLKLAIAGGCPPDVAAVEEEVELPANREGGDLSE